MRENDISAELVARVSEAFATRTPIRITGGGSKSFLGCRFEGEAVDVGSHCGIVEYEPNELVVTARAGTRLETIESILGEHGQALGFEPPQYSPAATIGGTLACNVSGPARPWRGSVRDAVLGVRLINGRGEHMRFGGRVIKNVAGFDVSRLQAGAFGCLGVMTDISLKVLPKPERNLTVVHELDAQAAVRRMNEIAGRAVPVSGAAWLAGRQYIRLSGTDHAVEAARRALGGEQLEADLWTAIRDHTDDFFIGARATALWRLSVDSTSQAMLEAQRLLLAWGGGLRYVHAEASLGDMSRVAAAAGGFAMRYSHNDENRAFMQQPSPTLRQLHERLKKAFDPAGILNRGRLYDWL